MVYCWVNMLSVKMAFKHPDLVARVGIFGHGLSQPDAERLAAWVDATPAEQWPRVLIDIGYHDPGMRYGQWLIGPVGSQGRPLLAAPRRGPAQL